MCVYCDTSKSCSGSGYSIISERDLNMSIMEHQNSEFYIIISLYEENKNIKGTYNNSPYKGFPKRIYYCPMCGREL